MVARTLARLGRVVEALTSRGNPAHPSTPPRPRRFSGRGRRHREVEPARPRRPRIELRLPAMRRPKPSYPRRQAMAGG